MIQTLGVEVVEVHSNEVRWNIVVRIIGQMESDLGLVVLPVPRPNTCPPLATEPVFGDMNRVLV